MGQPPSPRRPHQVASARAHWCRRFLNCLGTLLLAVAAGCSSPADAGSAGAPDKGFISGNGTVRLIPKQERQEPVSFAGRTLEGARFDVSEHRGKVVVVNVWGSWCPPCIAEAPALQRVWEQTESRGVQFVGIDTRDGAAQARAHQRKFGVTYPSVFDDDGRVLLAFRGTLPPTAIPSTLVLDRKGRIAARILGETSAGVLKGIVDDVLAEKGKGAS